MTINLRYTQDLFRHVLLVIPTFLIPLKPSKIVESHWYSCPLNISMNKSSLANFRCEKLRDMTWDKQNLSFRDEFSFDVSLTTSVSFCKMVFHLLLTLYLKRYCNLRCLMLACFTYKKLVLVWKTRLYYQVIQGWVF